MAVSELPGWLELSPEQLSRSETGVSSERGPPLPLYACVFFSLLHGDIR